MRPLVSKYSLNKGIEILHLVDLFIVGTFLELLGSLLAFCTLFLVSHIEENSLSPLPYKHELKRKEYHQYNGYKG